MRRLKGNIVDLVGRRIFSGTVEWSEGRIVGVVPGSVPKGSPFIAPGLVDAHVHVESSMLPPAEFARMAVVHGTVGTVSDPHEIANVLGVPGVEYMIGEARRTPFKFCFGAPSCVPATGWETSGATLGPRAVAALLKRPEIGYLSEFMNFPPVLKRERSAMAKIKSAALLGKPVDGHAPGLRGSEAQRYAAAGISTDHECFTLEEALDKIAAGMSILIREGSAARNFEALKSLLKTHPSKCMFCCDDQHPDSLLKAHIDDHVRRALASGADRLDVLCAASLNAVRHYRLDVGLLQPGDSADFIVFGSWDDFKVRETYLRGERVAAKGVSFLPKLRSATPNAFRARPVKASSFQVKAKEGRLSVIGAIDGQLITRALRVVPKRSGDHLVADRDRDLLKIAVVNRYEPKKAPAVAFIRGFGLRRGALASSVAHDSHNIVAVGADDESLAAAVNLVIKHRGGVSVVTGKSSHVVPLPIAGLMSTSSAEVVARDYGRADQAARDLGSKLRSPFMTLSFMALLVIPELKLSDRGLFAGARGKKVPVIS